MNRVQDPTLTNNNEAPFILVGLSDISVFPDWYVKAFGATGHNAHMITDAQRLVPGVFVMKDKKEFRAAVFGRVEKGNSSQTL